MGPESALKDVVGIHGGTFAEHAAASILENTPSRNASRVRSRGSMVSSLGDVAGSGREGRTRLYALEGRRLSRSARPA